MPFVTMTAPLVSDPTRQDWAQLVVDNLNFIASQNSGGGGLPVLVNGSFEVGTGASDPTGWVGTRATGNTTLITTTASDVQHGVQGLKMTTPGGVTGGIVFTSDQFYNCAEGAPFTLCWFFKSSSATSSVSVAVKWYDISGSVVSTTTLYSASSSLPTTWTFMMGRCEPPATAKQFKVVLTGVNNTTNASNYWDGVAIYEAKSASSIVFISSGTYTPDPGVTKLHARLLAGGGGGGGGGGGADNSFAATAGNNGNDGGDTWIRTSAEKARGGKGGGGATGSAGAGLPGGAGTAATARAGAISGSGTLVQFGAVSSDTGNAASTNAGAQGASATSLPWDFKNLAATAGGNGGTSGPTAGSVGGTGAANYGMGGGGGGGGGSTAASATGGGGGGASGAPGEFADLYLVVAAGDVLTVTIGPGGTGGSAGAAGGGGSRAGGAGGPGSTGLAIIEPC